MKKDVVFVKDQIAKLENHGIRNFFLFFLIEQNRPTKLS